MTQATDTLDAVSSVVDKYAQLLGLQFRTTPRGAFVLTFTAVDPAAPDRACWFELLPGAAAGEPYALLDCQPPLAQAEALLAELNSGGTAAARYGLSRFVGAMRAAFRATAPMQLEV